MQYDKRYYLILSGKQGARRKGRFRELQMQRKQGIIVHVPHFFFNGFKSYPKGYQYFFIGKQYFLEKP